MKIVDPVTLGDVACTRASVKKVYDRTGTLVQVPANTLAVTYDPSDLTKAPYALIEPAASNLLPNPDQVYLGGWSSNGGAFANYVADPAAGTNATRWSFGAFGDGMFYRATTMVDNGIYTLSIHFRPNLGGGQLRVGLESPAQYVLVDVATGQLVGSTGVTNYGVIACANGWYRVYVSVTADPAGNKTVVFYSNITALFSLDWYGAQLEAGSKLTSYCGASRAADSIAAGAGLAYSNVAITETLYSAAATYASGAQVYDPATYAMYQSLVDANVGNALTNTTKWAPLASTVVNRWRMFDQYNNTQTANAEEILLVVSPQLISQGFYIGNVDATEVRLSVVDLSEGLVYQETQSLIVSNSASSFFNWCFKRIKKKTWAVSLGLPVYANALVTIAIKKPGATAKCGMCAVGPVVDLGETLKTLGAEIKDYSETTFNFDGTSSTTLRGYAKRITADVSVPADQVDSVYEALADYRQRPLVWVGSKTYGIAIAFGRYSSFKPVIKGANKWEMALQIEGTV
jgi:hypothetical protein